jgi:hypothetical protein
VSLECRSFVLGFLALTTAKFSLLSKRSAWIVVSCRRRASSQDRLRLIVASLLAWREAVYLLSQCSLSTTNSLQRFQLRFRGSTVRLAPGYPNREQQHKTLLWNGLAVRRRPVSCAFALQARRSNHFIVSVLARPAPDR